MLDHVLHGVISYMITLAPIIFFEKLLPWIALLIGVGAAGALGLGKEFLWDYSPDIKDLLADGLGISAAIWCYYGGRL